MGMKYHFYGFSSSYSPFLFSFSWWILITPVSPLPAPSTSQAQHNRSYLLALLLTHSTNGNAIHSDGNNISNATPCYVLSSRILYEFSCLINIILNVWGILSPCLLYQYTPNDGESWCKRDWSKRGWMRCIGLGWAWGTEGREKWSNSEWK